MTRTDFSQRVESSLKSSWNSTFQEHSTEAPRRYRVLVASMPWTARGGSSLGAWAKKANGWHGNMAFRGPLASCTALIEYVIKPFLYLATRWVKLVLESWGSSPKAYQGAKGGSRRLGEKHMIEFPPFYDHTTYKVRRAVNEACSHD